MSDEKIKLRMQTSIASADWSHQRGDVVEIDSALALKWIDSGIAVRAAKSEPLGSAQNLLLDLSAEEALLRHCTHCERRAAYVLGNKSFCPQHFWAELEAI